MANPSHDGLYDKAVMIVRASKRASIPLLQRHLRIGYNRAARLMEAMGQAGIVVPLQTGWVMPDDATPPSPSTAPVVDERAAFESWAGPREFDLRRPHKTYHNTCTDYAWMGWQARAALASRPAEVDDEGLPPLPPEAARAMKGAGAFYVKWQEAGKNLRGALLLYTAEQYRQGQRDAVAADRARRGAGASNCRPEEQPQAPNWRALGYVEGATVRQEIGLGRYDDAVITYADRNGALDVEINGIAYGWSAQFCKVVVPADGKKAAD